MNLKLVLLSAALFASACSKSKAPKPELTDSSKAASAAVVATPVATPSPAPVTIQFETIYFDFDSYVLTTSAQTTLKRLAEDLRAAPQVKIQLEGHCDERGSNEYNLALGERRSYAVLEYLVGLGVERSALSAISYGEERPIAMGQNEASWSQNRRVEGRILN